MHPGARALVHLGSGALEIPSKNPRTTGVTPSTLHPEPYVDDINPALPIIRNIP